MKTMAGVLVVLLGMASTAAAQRQQVDQAELKKRLDSKKEADFLKNAAWMYDFEKAKETAQSQDKRIFAYFTRSYAP